MKKILFSIITMSITAASINAQTTPVKQYNFTHSSGNSYQQLNNNATLVGFPIDWDDEVSDNITMPFTFMYQGEKVENFAIETYGSVILNDKFLGDFESGNIAGIYMDYESKNRGQVYYQTTGTTPNRILKIEYRNVGRYNDTLAVDTFNFQIWMHETSNMVEYHVGYSNLSDTSFAQNINDLDNDKEVCYIGLLTTNNSTLSSNEDDNNFQVQVYKNSAYIDSIFNLADVMTQTVNIENILAKKVPTNGEIFKYIPVNNWQPPTSIVRNNEIVSAISPNPSNNGKFTVNTTSGAKKYQVYNILGQIILEGTSTENKIQINLSNTSKGNYILKVIQDGVESNSKLIIN